MILKDKIKREELQIPFTKAALDIEKETVSLGCELHIDCVDELIKNGSAPKDIWGFNIYPDGHLDFVSLINIRPADDNRSMEIKNQEIRQKIEKIIKELMANDQ